MRKPWPWLGKRLGYLIPATKHYDMQKTPIKRLGMYSLCLLLFAGALRNCWGGEEHDPKKTQSCTWYDTYVYFTLDGKKTKVCMYHAKHSYVPHEEEVKKLQDIVTKLEKSPGPNPKVANQLVDGEPLLCWTMCHPTPRHGGYYYFDIARYLIEKGADVNDTRGKMTALQIEGLPADT